MRVFPISHNVLNDVGTLQEGFVIAEKLFRSSSFIYCKIYRAVAQKIHMGCSNLYTETFAITYTL